ncbi:MAG TPA: 1-(5-phosphoribosyl)-5-((5-phosphoribosylamino)methylideneamino)imidazole-4-carboxamide isomerase [Gammaproteobacteria bacterium]|nr:1-(5-phosphoribosyl)-5-((5-phosphoribosylamino)methylideneamino)imidazole-4-carboxamide isomerase [Gammaproteobacteria bacterium]HBF07085.1 1-(5-phosphoribosyl)-5-((5-phosphoribosylamino)methylideneamino)imidazole-4-carboxamide isomerase [Gammaproteobacteria bacterium]HCK91465.1 1-(5-phosphoribosyl)-5-((5-phosphoribosylamino)methylideneamino)imidazole-4-carboxamide isomerase [Gammaproteobacteria bacterium]|tara:strand:+ start:409 stop:798 length:390 start_codon:yes stop_codon:yes gene_type:complete
MTQTPIPTQIQRLKKSNQLRLIYSDSQFELPAEFLRVHSPSAEVRQHGNPILVEGKANVTLIALENIGRYGLKITYDDGHDSGIYTWPYLYELCNNYNELWDSYLKKLHDENKSRHPQTQVVQIQPPKK